MKFGRYINLFFTNYKKRIESKVSFMKVLFLESDNYHCLASFTYSVNSSFIFNESLQL